MDWRRSQALGRLGILDPAGESPLPLKHSRMWGLVALKASMDLGTVGGFFLAARGSVGIVCMVGGIY